MLQFPLSPEVGARLLLAYKRRVLGNPYHRPAGSSEGGEFTSAPGSVKLYRGDAKSLNPSLSYSDPGALFGSGIYLTDSKRIAGDYTSKGAEVVFRYSGGSKNTKQDAIDNYIRQQAQYIDAKGQPLRFPQSMNGYVYIKGSNPSAEFKRLADEDTRRLGYAKKEWEATKSSYEVRKHADNTITIRKKEETGHVAHYEIPKAWIAKTLNAEDPIPDKVAGALHDAIYKESPGLARDVHAFARSRNDDGEYPTFREVYQRSHEAMMNGIDNEASQLKMRQSLKELGYKGIRYAGGVTMGGARHTAYVFWDEQGLKKVRVLGGAGSGNYGHVGRPGEVGGSGKGNVTSYDDSGVSDNVIADILGSGVNVRRLAEGMVKYADENFRIEVTTTGGGPDEYQLQEEYDQYVAREQASEARVYAEEQGQRQREIAQIWRETEQETLAIDPYGDVSKHPALPGFELTGGRPSEPRVSYEELTAGTDTSAPFNEEERQTIRERLQGTGGPLPLSRSELINQYLETHEDFEGQSFREWVNDRSDGGASDEASVEISFNGDKGAIITRVFTQTDAGLTVDHHYFQVPKARQSGGLAKDVFRGSVEEYEKIGVDRIDVQANIDRGAYAWARYGFKPNDPEEVNSNLLRWAEYKVSPAARDAIRHAVDNGDSDTAIWRVVDTVLDGEKIAKPLLLDEQWFGHFNFSDAEAKARLKKYITRPTPKMPPSPLVVPTVTLKTAAANRGGTELFYIDENGEKGDAEIWAVLLDEPDLLDDFKGLAFNPDEPRDDQGQWTIGPTARDIQIRTHRNSPAVARVYKGVIDKAVQPLRDSGMRRFDVNEIPANDDNAGDNDHYWKLGELARRGIPGETYWVNGYFKEEGQWSRGDDVKVTLPVELATLGSASSGNYGHAGRPGEVGGSAPDTGPHSTPELEAQAQAGIAAVEKLLPEAIKTAEYERHTPETWDELSQEDQNKAYDAWAQSAEENLMNNSDGSVYNEVKKEQVDEIHQDTAFEERVYAKVDEQLAAQGLKLGEEEFSTTETIPDHYAESETGHPTLDTAGLKHADGTPLTEAEQKTAGDTWDGTYESMFQGELETRMNDQVDHINEMESEGISQQLSDEWGNMSESEKMQIALNNVSDGFESSGGLDPGAPNKWVTGIDGERASEDYQRTHAVANRLTELRTDEIRNERGIGVGREYKTIAKENGRFDITDSDGKIIHSDLDLTAANRAFDDLNHSSNITSEDLISQTWSEWKNSSSSQMGLTLQLATARELGGVHRLLPGEIEQIEQDFGPHSMQVMQAYARAQWETTQFVMSKAGQEDIKVYRALMLPGADVKTLRQEEFPSVKSGSGGNTSYGDYTKLPDLALQRAGAQSSSGTLSVVNSWQGVGNLPPDPQRVILRIHAPRTSVLSLPVYGVNTQKEHEVVLAGAKDKWSWDVWKGHAPAFESTPISHLKAAEIRMLVGRYVLDIQALDRGQPHWLRGMVDPVVLRSPRFRGLGGSGSGNFGHAGRPGEVGGSGSGLTGEAAVAAIRRGEPHLASEQAFVDYHDTGRIESGAYERYEAGDLDFIHKKDFDTLLDTREVNGETVEIRLATEPVTYVKQTVALGDAERDRLYNEYEAAAKALGTSPMMAGIDLGWGSDKYNQLLEYEKRWRDSGSEIVRDSHGQAVYMTPEEIQAAGLSSVGHTVGAFVGDKTIGYAGNEFGASGVYLAKQYQRHGLGLTLLKTYLEKSGRLAKGVRLGQMTPAGHELTRALHRQLVKEAQSRHLGLGNRSIRGILKNYGQTSLRTAFDPSQPRDKEGKWTDTGVSVPGTGTGGGIEVPVERAKAQAGRPAPNKIVQADAQAYATAHGLGTIDHRTYHTVDERRARSIADAYDALPVDDSSNPAVAEAYHALALEVNAQYAHAVANGMQFIPWTKEGQPYATSVEMAEDVRKNKRLYFYTGGEPHPFLGAVDPETGLTSNDKFRAIHDYYGHAAGGFGFGARGEENAWAVHSQMFTESARQAMTTETRGQNSWVNFGSQNYNADGTHKNIPPGDRPFAAQKTAILPEEFLKVLGGAGSGNFGHVGRPGEVGGSASEGMSASERYNRDLHEEQRIQKLVSEAETSRNTAVEKLRESHYTPERSVADIEKLVYTDPEYLKAEQALKAIAGQWTDARLALTASESAMKVEKVTHRAEAIANQLEIDPSIIHVVDKEPTPFVVGSHQFHEAGHYNPADGQIEINARNSYDDRMSVTNGLVAHEIFHHQFHEVQKAVESEHETLKQMVGSPEFKRLFSGGDYDHTPRPEMMAELRERFPASAAWADTWGDVFLTPRNLWDSRSQKMIDEDGHSAYARSYWTKDAIQQRGGTYFPAINETLAEVNRWLTSPTAWHESGNPPPKSPWVQLNQDIRKGYKTLKERRLVGAAFNESEHPRDDDGKFTGANFRPDRVDAQHRHLYVKGYGHARTGYGFQKHDAGRKGSQTYKAYRLGYDHGNDDSYGA